MGNRAPGSGLRVPGFGFRVKNFRFSVPGSRSSGSRSPKPSTLLLLLLLVIAPQLSAVGLAQSTLPQLQRELERGRAVQQQQQQQIRQLNQDLKLIDSVTQENLKRLGRLEGEMVRLEEERADLTRQIGLLQGQVDQANTKIALLDDDLSGLKERLAVLMNNLHREKAGRYLPLLRAQSFTDLATRARWISVLGKEQTTLMERIRYTVGQLEDERTRLTLLVQDLNQKQVQREERIQLLAESRLEFQQVLATLQQQKQGRQLVLRTTLQAQAQLQQDISVVQTRILSEQKRLAEEQRKAEMRRRAIEAAKIRAEKKRLAEEAALKAKEAKEAKEKAQREKEARQAREAEEAARLEAQKAQTEAQEPSGPSRIQSGPSQIQSGPSQIQEVPRVPKELVGRLLFPMSGGRPVSGFDDGHSFQEIQGPGPRSPVRAAANGIAATVQPNPNLGWTVVIQHTTDLFTAYTNLQDLRISSGERVNQGQVLGLSGSAALIPPDTIWFTVRINDTPINPAVLY